MGCISSSLRRWCLAEPSNVTASCRGEDGGGSVRESYSSVAGMSEVEISAAIEKSKEQGWSELADGAQDAAASSSDALDSLIWEELKERNPRVFTDFSEGDVKVGRMIAEGGQAHIYEVSIDDGGDIFEGVAKVFKSEGFSLADFKRQWPLATKDPTTNDGIQERMWGDFVMGEVVLVKLWDIVVRYYGAHF